MFHFQGVLLTRCLEWQSSLHNLFTVVGKSFSICLKWKRCSTWPIFISVTFIIYDLQEFSELFPDGKIHVYVLLVTTWGIVWCTSPTECHIITAQWQCVSHGVVRYIKHIEEIWACKSSTALIIYDRIHIFFVGLVICWININKNSLRAWFAFKVHSTYHSTLVLHINFLLVGCLLILVLMSESVFMKCSVIIFTITVFTFHDCLCNLELGDYSPSIGNTNPNI